MSTSQGVIFLKKKDVNGGSNWFEDGDEENNGKYVGKIENGKPNGHGTLTSPEGDKYEGEWKDGEKHGQGTYIWSNGEKYEGEWKDGLIHGQGTYNWSYGKKYVGEWKNGKEWNLTSYDKYGNILGKWVNGE